MSGLDQLYDDLEGMAEVLEAFEHPEVDRRPSARLLRDTLLQRREAVEDKLSEVRRDHLEVELTGPREVPARLVVDVLDHVVAQLDRAVAELLADDAAPSLRAAAVSSLTELDVTGDRVVLRLSGPDLPREAVPRTPDDDSVLGAAGRTVVEESGGDDELSRVLATGPASAVLRATGPGGSVEVEVAAGPSTA